MAFHIVREISSGQKRIEGRMVDTIQAIVDFGMASPGLTTRHLERHPVFDDKGKITGHQWTGWNSDQARRERAEILKARQDYDEAVADGESLVGKLETELTGLKGKRGVDATAERKRLKTLLKGNEAALAVIKSGRDRATAIAGKVDETHPEIVAFV